MTVMEHNVAHYRARAEAAEQEAAGLRLQVAEMGKAAWNDAMEVDCATRRATAMHRRAQEAERLLGLAMRMGLDAVESTKSALANIYSLGRQWERRYRVAAGRLAEADGLLPPANDTATRLDTFAAKVDEWGPLTSASAGAVNGEWLAETLRLAAATIRTKSADLATERTMADDAKRAWVLRAESLHEELRRLRETVAAIEDGTCEDLPALLRRYGKMRAVVEALTNVCDRTRAAHGMGCRCADCRDIRAALAACDEGGSDV